MDTDIDMMDIDIEIPETKPPPMDFCRSQTGVSMTLAKHLITAGGAKNLVFSPLSIHVVLGWLAAGFKGKPQDDLLRYLRSNSAQEFNYLSLQLFRHVFADGTQLGGPRLSSANGMWINYDRQLTESFQQAVDPHSQADFYGVDFYNRADEVREEVNAWAEMKTNGLIKDVLPPGMVDRDTRLILANAVYFKGAWEQSFDASDTRVGEFFLLDGNRIQAPFITSYKNQQIGVFNGFKVLRLPYRRGQDERHFSMYFYLPDAKDGLPHLVNKVGSEPGFIENHIPNSSESVGEFRFPKFKIHFHFQAQQLLSNLGLQSTFGSNLSEMAKPIENDKGLYVTAIIHKSFIEVNEEGTEAAAVTVAAMSFGSCCLPVKTVDFVADHPFLFVIREDRTGTVLFVGQVVNPLAD